MIQYHNWFKVTTLMGLAGLGLALAGCQSESLQAPAGDFEEPHRAIAEVIDFDRPVDEIANHYTKSGQDWLRMSFPDPNHQAYALKHIGKQVPDVAFSPLSEEAISLRDRNQQTILYFADANNALTKEMNGYLDTFQKENIDITVYSIYGVNSPNEVQSIYEKEGWVFDKSLIVAGEDATSLIDSFDVKESPLLVYIDKTQTIAYTAVGFRDLVFLNDHAESAFGEHPFYKWIDADFEADLD